MGSQVELHPIIGDFPTGITHGAKFGALFVQYGIGVVEVDEDALGFSETKRPLKQAALTPERKMPHIASCFSAALGGHEFVVLPECAIKESEVAFVHGALPFFAHSRDAGTIEESLFLVHHL